MFTFRRLILTSFNKLPCRFNQQYRPGFKEIPAKMAFKYPEVRRDETVVDNYFGVQVKDPYRWLEDPDSEETKKFVDAQNNVTVPFVTDSPYRATIHERLKKQWDYPKYGCPSKKGNRYFFYKNSGLQNQSVLYKRETLSSEPEEFLDPNKLSEDGTVALSGTAFSEDGATFAYGLSSSGSDWITVHFKKVENGENYPEVLRQVKFTSLAWTHDCKGIFYGRFPSLTGTDGSETESVEHQKLYYHRIGTDQSQDVLVAEFPEEPKFRIGVAVSPCGRYVILTPMKGCRDNLLYVCDLEKVKYEINGLLPLTQIVFKLESDYDFITSHGQNLVFRTNRNAPNYRLVEIDLSKPKEENWRTLIPEHAKDVLDWAQGVDKDKLVLCYIRDVKSVLQCHSLTDGSLIFNFPLDVGTINGFSGDEKHSEIFYQFISFLTPGVIWRCDLNDKPPKPELYHEVKVEGFNREEYTTEQVFYKSPDNTKVPMFIVHKRGLKLDGKNPCLLYGYGGFNVSIQPVFSAIRLTFMQLLNGVFAVPNIRGGGEFGEKWHNGGRLGNKQNVFDDFQSAAEYLIEKKYTDSSKLTIQGGSNGGLLVAACINQRPELFGAAICQVGVLDMLRFHKFTIGHAWTTDYGSSEDKEQFEYLYKYSPIHNVRIPAGSAQYPATLLLTADHDDRVVPLHSLKFIATLQHTLKDHPSQTNPLLIRVETKAGHGGGKPTSKVIDEYTDIFTFIIKTLNLQINA